VGNIVIRGEAVRDLIPPMPLDVCGADSQGGIGYMLQQVLGNELTARGVQRSVASIVTQSIVRRDDPGFSNPTKPIGPYYDADQAADLRAKHNWTFVEDGGRSRRVVPSPRAQEIVEWEVIRTLVEAGTVVIAAGGGGVPVVREWNGRLRGVEGVVDKDQAASVLARQLRADRLVILTAVDRVALDFRRPTQREVDRLTVSEARAHLADGQFPPGSMGPKIEACVEFVDQVGGVAVITSPGQLRAAIDGTAGTRIVPDGTDG
jgi:carbamate kinase